ncbi:MAG: hypothetical protein AAGI22_14220, partial [Planctomycetota bacterium]
MEALAEVARVLLEGGAAALPLGDAGVDWVSRDHDETLQRVDAAARVDAPGAPPPRARPPPRGGRGRRAPHAPPGGGGWAGGGAAPGASTRAAASPRWSVSSWSRLT